MSTGYRLLSRSQVSSQSPDGAGRAEFAVKFAEVQETLRQDPYRIGLPGVSVGRRFAELSLPIQSEFWILEDAQSGRSLGRIAANLSPFYPGNGYLGFFEAQDFSAAQALVHTALGWLKAQGVTSIYGPVNFNTWLSYRFRVNPEPQSPTFAFEPVNPPEYPLWFRELGFQLSEGYHSDGLDGLEGMAEGTRTDYDSAISRGYTFRTWDGPQLIDRDVPILYDISMKSFQKNFLFEPVPFEFFRELYLPLMANKVDLSLAFFVCNPQGKEVGFFFNFIDSGYFVLKTTALLPETRGQRLSNALLHLSVREACSRGINKSMAALMRDGIQSESYSKKQKRIWRNDYALFKKEL